MKIAERARQHKNDGCEARCHKAKSGEGILDVVPDQGQHIPRDEGTGGIIAGGNNSCKRGMDGSLLIITVGFACVIGSSKERRIATNG